MDVDGGEASLSFCGEIGNHLMNQELIALPSIRLLDLSIFRVYNEENVVYKRSHRQLSIATGMIQFTALLIHLVSINSD